jgi:serine/threonine protein kinase
MNDVPSPSPRLPKSSPNALPGGTRLDEFEVLKLLGVGGFGIVYLAFDHALEREVAVKEYMPAHLAGRGQTLEVLLHSNVDAQTFAMGLRSFLNEARFLARFDHPSLLKVLRFWQANGTAYMAMPVLHGRTLSEEHQAMSAPPSQAWLLALIEPLLGALEKLHAQGVYHRDIAPDNIQIEPGGRPVLLDFGAARRVISDHSQALTAILKPAYSPIEQYAEAGAVKQGPWTDFYALGATLHCLLLGRPPPPATTRTVHDEPLALTPQTCPQCSAQFLQMVDWMLAPRPHDRPQSVAALRPTRVAGLRRAGGRRHRGLWPPAVDGISRHVGGAAAAARATTVVTARQRGCGRASWQAEVQVRGAVGQCRGGTRCARCVGRHAVAHVGVFAGVCIGFPALVGGFRGASNTGFCASACCRCRCAQCAG